MKYTAETAKFIFGQEMRACPSCGSYHLGYSTPIKMAEPIKEGDSAKTILGKWARSRRGGATPLEGPCRIMCRGCGHLAPSVDCTGKTAEEVGRDANIAKEIKRLWNSQI